MFTTIFEFGSILKNQKIIFFAIKVVVWLKTFFAPVRLSNQNCVGDSRERCFEKFSIRYDCDKFLDKPISRPGRIFVGFDGHGPWLTEAQISGMQHVI